MTDARAAEIAALMARLAELIAERPTPEPSSPRPVTERVLLTVEEAAQRLRIGRTRMFALVKSGAVESVRIGRLRRVSIDALNAYTATLAANQSAA